MFSGRRPGPGEPGLREYGDVEWYCRRVSCEDGSIGRLAVCTCEVEVYVLAGTAVVLLLLFVVVTIGLDGDGADEVEKFEVCAA